MSKIRLNAVLGDLELVYATLNNTDRLFDAYSIFEKDSSIPGIILIKEGRFYRMLSKTKFYEVMSKQYMYDLFSHRKASFFFDENVIEPYLILDSNTHVTKAANEALNRDENFRFDPIIVDLGNEEYKLLDFYKLILAQNLIQLQTLDLLNEANEFKKDILRISAHDLRNPLNVIMGFSSLVLKDSNISNVVSEYVGFIDTAAKQMHDLINEFLISAINNSTDLEIGQTTFDILELIHSVVQSFKLTLEMKGQSIEFNYTNHELLVYADKQKITEVLQNLISNAIKYSEYNQEIHIQAEKQSDKICVSVKDNGPGLTQADHNKVFGKFQKLSARPTGNESSTGLGLYIVKKIIKCHGGTVWVESEYGHGSTFFFTLNDVYSQENNSTVIPLVFDKRN
jgi:signal transduction histidine kinase